MKEVSETTLDLSSDMTDATEVFNGLLSMPTTNPDGYTITFSQGYTYKGGNLLIGVYNDTKGSWNKVRWYGIGNQSSRVSAYGYNPNSLETVSLSSAQSFLPKTTFTYTMPVPAGPTTSGIDWNPSTNSGTFLMPAYDVEVSTELWYKLKQNGETPAANKAKADVFLERTLSNSMWSTFCAPFDAAIPDGWTVKEFTGSDYNASTQTLTLDFTNATSIVAGTPYLVKADVDGPTFDGVTQDWTAYNEVTPATNGGYATFVPVLTPTTLYANDKTKLYLGGNNTLYYPSGDVNVNGFRAYFKLNNGLTAGDLPNTARAFVLNIDGDQTGIRSLTPDASPKGEGSIYSLDGRKVQNTTRKGVYIVNGKKVVIK